jgi:hypothetical protein
MKAADYSASSPPLTGHARLPAYLAGRRDSSSSPPRGGFTCPGVKTMLKFSALALAALLATGAQAANHAAMPASAPASAIPKGEGVTRPGHEAQPGSNARADVKAGATAANKSGEIKKGEGPSPAPVQPTTSVKARAEVKADAASAVKAGAIGKGADVPASGVKK